MPGVFLFMRKEFVSFPKQSYTKVKQAIQAKQAILET